jgi:hypothetical protein
MRHLAERDVTARAASYLTLNDASLWGKTPLHVILSDRGNEDLSKVRPLIRADLSRSSCEPFMSFMVFSSHRSHEANLA